MIHTKTPVEIAYMREGGAKLGAIRDELCRVSRVGVNLMEIENIARKRITEAGGEPSFPTVEGYKWCTCLCINDEVVHGMPRNYALQSNDLLTIDVGMIYKGFHIDTAYTKIIHDSPLQTEFLTIGERTLTRAIAESRVGGRVGHISKVIQEGIEGAGYHVVRSLVGHGVGRILHEEPQIPGVLKGTIENTQELVEGMTIAIEVIYAEGSGSLVYNDDGWTIATKDHSLSAVFEHSIAITKAGPIVLTKT